MSGIINQNIEQVSSMPSLQTFVFLDLESTGLPGIGEKPRITELSLVAVHRTLLRKSRYLPRVMDKLTVCVYPMRPVNPQATDLTGLSNDNLYCHKDFDARLVTLLSSFLSRLDPPVCLVAHNGNKFDFGLLQVELQSVGQTLPRDLTCVDSLQMFRRVDLADGDGLPHGDDAKVCTPEKQARNGGELVETGSSSLRKRKPELVAHRVPPGTAKKRLFETGDSEEKGVAGLELQGVSVANSSDKDDGAENPVDTADGNDSKDKWTWNDDLTDSELLVADVKETSTEDKVVSLVASQEDIENAGAATSTACTTDSASLCVAESTKHGLDIVGTAETVSHEDAACDTTEGVGVSTPAKVIMMSPSVLYTPPYSPGYASKMADRNTSSTSSKKQCYNLRELHRRVVGYYPINTHQAEDDCLALVRIFQNSASRVCEWADYNAVPFNSIPPLYKTKARRPLPDGTFPYQF